MEKVLETYVPRHSRLGVCVKTPVVQDVHEVLDTIPIVDDGSLVQSETRMTVIPAEEDMQQYKLSAFRLSAMLEAGVPLNVVNVNKSNAATIDDLEKVCQNIDDADKYVQYCLSQKSEKESWFKAFEDEKESYPIVDSLNEIY